MPNHLPHWSTDERHVSTAISRRRWLRSVAASASLLALPCGWFNLATPAKAAAPPPSGTGSRQVREQAARALALDKLSPADQARVQSVVNDTAIFRRLATQTFACDPTLFLFLIDRPEVIINIWRELGMTQMELTRTGAETFKVDDKAGTLGTVEFLYRSHDTHLLYASGVYEGPIFNRRTHGRCVLQMKSAYVLETNGRYYVTCQLDAFVAIDNLASDLVARTLQPLVTPILDHNFHEAAVFLTSFNQATEVNPAGVRHLANRLQQVPEPMRVQLGNLADEVALRAAEAEALASEAALLNARRNPQNQRR